MIDLEHFVKSYAQIIVTQLYCYKENTQLISPAQLGLKSPDNKNVMHQNNEIFMTLPQKKASKTFR
ncbi:TPA: hypothetical protein N5O13_003075 [Enterobacter cloacae subsp. cloacae]|nr:hypothetical protein [Enterobacter cloacae subsp. cloacae]